MRIVVTANDPDLEAPVNPLFGRCELFMFVDTDTMAFEAAENPAIGSAHGAGIQAAQFIVEQGAQAVLTGQVGPNAFDVLQAAQVSVYTLPNGATVRQAVEAFLEGRLQKTNVANGPQGGGHGGRSASARP